MATVYQYDYSKATATVTTPAVSLAAGTVGATTISTNAATTTVVAGLKFYENAIAQIPCSSPSVVTTLTPPGTSGSFTLTSGQTACLWTPQYGGSSTSIIAGTTPLDLWASSGASAPTDDTTGASGGTSTTPTCVYGSNPAQNSVLVVAFYVSPNTITVNTPTDTLLNTFSQIATTSLGTPKAPFAIYIYAATQSHAAGADTVTLSFTGTVAESYVTCWDAVGITPTARASQTGSGTYISGTSTTLSTASLTPTSGDLEYAFGAYQPCSTSGTPGYTSGWTPLAARGTDFTGSGSNNCAAGTKYSVNAMDEYILPGSTASTASIGSGTWGTAVTTNTWGWAEVQVDFVHPNTLSVDAYTTDSTGAHQNTLVSSGTTGALTSTESEVLSSFSSSAGTVPASGYIEVTVTASASVTIYWGSGQLTNFKTPSLYNYLIQMSNSASSTFSVSLATKSDGSQITNIARLSAVTVSFVSPSSNQVIISSGGVTQGSGTPQVLPASPGTIDIQVDATASSTGSSSVTMSLKIAPSGSAAYAMYTIVLTVN